MYYYLVALLMATGFSAGCSVGDKGCEDDSDCRSGRACIQEKCTWKTGLQEQPDMDIGPDQSEQPEQDISYCPEFVNCSECRSPADCPSGQACFGYETSSECRSAASCVIVMSNPLSCSYSWECGADQISFSCDGSECWCDHGTGSTIFQVAREDRCTNLAFIENMVNLECAQAIHTQ